MTNAQTVANLVEAFNRRDVEGVLALIDERVELAGPPRAAAAANGPVGLGQLRAELERLVAESRFTPLGLIEAAGTVIVPGRLEPRLPRGRRAANGARELVERLGSLSLSLRDGLVVRIALHLADVDGEYRVPAVAAPVAGRGGRSRPSGGALGAVARRADARGAVYGARRAGQ
jgi:hypothetical protein